MSQMTNPKDRILAYQVDYHQAVLDNDLKKVLRTEAAAISEFGSKDTVHQFLDPELCINAFARMTSALDALEQSLKVRT